MRVVFMEKTIIIKFGIYKQPKILYNGEYKFKNSCFTGGIFMSVLFRNYGPEPFFSDDYRKVRDFLIRINAKKLTTPRMSWGAWEWAVTHGGRDQDNLVKIGLWEDNGNLVALATYECPLGEGFLCVDEAYAYLKPELVVYAKENLHDVCNL